MKPTTMKDYFAKSKARKAKRRTNARFQVKAGQLSGTMNELRAKTGRTLLKTQICRLLGLLDKKRHGSWCRLGSFCPAYARIGIHHGEVGYHLTPQARGDSVRFIPENVVWACSAANFGEYRNRSLYRDKHIQIFGKERIEAIEAKAREIVHFSTAELWDLRDSIKKQVENG